MQHELKNIQLPRINLAEIIRKMSSFEPKIVSPVGRNEAAVALLLSEGLHGPELLFIERAKRSGDPWSGQMAFPGGRREPADETVLMTAIRETSEEIGVDLAAENFIVQLDDLIAPKLSNAHGLIISCHLFQVARSTQFKPNEEVQDLVWLKLNDLMKSESFTDSYKPPNYDGVFPGFRINADDPRVIWGLTYRIVCNFFRTLGIAGY